MIQPPAITSEKPTAGLSCSPVMHRIITRSRSTAGVEGDERVCRAGIADPGAGDGMAGAGRDVGG